MRQANACTEGPAEASGHSPAEGPGRRYEVQAKRKKANYHPLWWLQLQQAKIFMRNASNELLFNILDHSHLILSFGQFQSLSY